MPSDLNQLRLEPELESARVLLNSIAEGGQTLTEAIEDVRLAVKAAELKLAQLEAMRGLRGEVPLPRKKRKDAGQPRQKPQPRTETPTDEVPVTSPTQA